MLSVVSPIPICQALRFTVRGNVGLRYRRAGDRPRWRRTSRGLVGLPRSTARATWLCGRYVTPPVTACASGHCAVGVCCALACAGDCVACQPAAGTAIGSCISLQDGTLCPSGQCSSGVRVQVAVDAGPPDSPYEAAPQLDATTCQLTDVSGGCSCGMSRRAGQGSWSWAVLVLVVGLSRRKATSEPHQRGVW